jgi:hypothetical protein
MKNSILAKTATLFFIVAIFTSCTCKDKPTETVASKLVSVDSLNNVWNTTWNSQNVEAISELFSENAVLVAGDWKVVGKDSLTEQWIKTSAPFMANLQTFPYRQNATETMAYSSGSYTHDVVQNDSVIGFNRGVFTFIWEARADKSWKVSAVQIQVIADK